MNMLNNMLERIKGGESSPPRQSIRHITWSFIGAFLGIYLVELAGETLQFALADTLFLVGSFGASAVLVYGAPQADFAQPRNLIGGHVFSALIGILVVQLLPFDIALQAAVAVSLAIVVMHLTRTLHPPGGATALIAVIGGPAIHDLGFLYTLSPIGIGALLLLLVALLVNNQSSDTGRHYPKYWL